MKIPIGDYTICSDKYCYWIVETKTTKEGKNPGTEYEEKIAGYSPDLQGLFEDFVRKAVRGSGAKTVEGALRKMAKAEKEAKEMISACLMIGMERRN